MFYFLYVTLSQCICSYIIKLVRWQQAWYPHATPIPILLSSFFLLAEIVYGKVKGKVGIIIIWLELTAPVNSVIPM